MSVWIVMQQMGMIVILVAIGVYLYKKDVVDNNVSKHLSVIVMDICNPALILSSILTFGSGGSGNCFLCVTYGIGISFTHAPGSK